MIKPKGFRIWKALEFHENEESKLQVQSVKLQCQTRKHNIANTTPNSQTRKDNIACENPKLPTLFGDILKFQTPNVPTRLRYDEAQRLWMIKPKGFRVWSFGISWTWKSKNTMSLNVFHLTIERRECRTLTFCRAHSKSQIGHTTSFHLQYEKRECRNLLLEKIKVGKLHTPIIHLKTVMIEILHSKNLEIAQLRLMSTCKCRSLEI